MVTLKDIAKRAGVNISSVSKALNDSHEISEEKKKEIRIIADELNYIPNLSARALAGKASNSIGVILPEIASNLYARMMNGIENELNNSNYSIIMSTTNFQIESEVKMLHLFCSRAVDGILLIGSLNKDIEDHVTIIKKKYDIPIILLESHFELSKHDYVTIDNQYGIDLAIKHFKKRGYQRIGYISDDISASARLRLFKSAMVKNDLTFENKYVKTGPERFELGGYLRMKELLATPDFPRAVLASYDDVAIGAIKAIDEAGYNIPGDIAIIGFDNIRVSEYLSRPLTTIVPPIEEMVSIGVRVLIDIILAAKPGLNYKLVLKPSLVLRETA